MPDSSAPIGIRTDFLGRMYVLGTKTYDENPEIKKEIDDLNKKIYDKSDDKINEIYEKGRKWSLDHFDLLYKILGTKFDKFIFESEMASIGLDVVKQNIGKVFELSDGATVFKGEEYGLHTRVFINSHGIPTYEAKDLGLNITKFKNYPDAIESIIITASEQCLQAVPQGFRETSMALGATRWQTIRYSVLPFATPGILTSTILGIARAALAAAEERDDA
jgi:arginyl-tRNA synthetase